MEKLSASDKKHSRKQIQPHNPTPPARKEKKVVDEEQD